MTPRARKIVLLTHITFSVGWIGGDLSFLVLAIAAWNSSEPRVLQSAYLAMQMIAWIVVIPLSAGSLFTDLVHSLGTKWGLFRHYGILIKFLLAMFAMLGLLVHTRPINYMAGAVTETMLSAGDLSNARLQLIVAAAAGLVLLLVNTGLAVFKPRGMTPYGYRKLNERT